MAIIISISMSVLMIYAHEWGGDLSGDITVLVMLVVLVLFFLFLLLLVFVVAGMGGR